MNFTQGAITNLRDDGDNGGSEDESDLPQQTQQASDEEGGVITRGQVERVIKIQLAVAQRQSQKVANQGTRILEQASKLKAMRNEGSGNSQFTAFNTKSLINYQKLQITVK